MPRIPSSLRPALLLLALPLAACGVPTEGNINTSRNATPAAEVACVDAINARHGGFTGMVVTSSERSGASTTVHLGAIDGSRWRCTSPASVFIPVHPDAR